MRVNFPMLLELTAFVVFCLAAIGFRATLGTTQLSLIAVGLAFWVLSSLVALGPAES